MRGYAVGMPVEIGVLKQPGSIPPIKVSTVKCLRYSQCCYPDLNQARIITPRKT